MLTQHIKLYILVVFSVLLSGGPLLFAGEGKVDTVKVLVPYDGIYKITGADLAAKGVGLPISDSKKINLYSRGNSIAIRIIYNNQSNSFTKDSWLEFYGEQLKRDDPLFEHNSINVYLLRLNDNSGPNRMQARKLKFKTASDKKIVSFMDTIHAEENTEYATNIKLAKGKDRWFYGNPILSGQERELQIFPGNLDQSKDSCNVRISLYGRSEDVFVDLDHNTIVYINNHDEIINEFWNGKGHKLIEVNNVSPCPLVNEEKTGIVNTIRIYSNPTNARADSVYLDWLEVDYWRTFNTISNRLKFKLNIETPSWLEVTGLKDGDIRIYNITEPDKSSFLQNFIFKGEKIEFTEKEPGQHEYFLASKDGFRVPLLKNYLAETIKNSSITDIDYIIITHPRFIDYLEPFIKHREAASNLKIKTVNLFDIYDEFGDGMQSPLAMKKFLQHAYNNWGSPEYVLLVGDASIDPKQNIPNSFSGMVPTYMLTTYDANDNRLQNKQAPSDDYFVTFSDDSPVPDMMIGRLPVKTKSELLTVISKIITYEENGSEAWNKKLLVIADNVEQEVILFKPAGRQNAPKKQNEFQDLAEELSTIADKDYSTGKIYLSDIATTITGDEPLDQKMMKAGDIAREKFIESINSGAVLTSYIGHGAVSSWAKENIFSAKEKDMSRLLNKNQLSFITTFNCLSGYFVSPFDGIDEPASMAEAFLLQEGGGAVATWMPTWVGRNGAHKILAVALYEAMFENRNSILGKAILDAKRIAAASGNDVPSDTIKTYTYFGDPALILHDNFIEKTGAGAVATGDMAASTADSGSGGGGGGGGGGGCFISRVNQGNSLQDINKTKIVFLFLAAFPLLITITIRSLKKSRKRT